MTSTSGLVIVDKPAGLTSHDVVARVRRLAGTRRVGHAGTLDPMATGVLVIGVEKATRMLGYLALTEKEYAATIRLGQSTSTDDAEGEITAGTPGASAAALTERQIWAAAATLTGNIMQVPPAVSAIKVGGKRAYRLTRSGAAPELPPRPVAVHEFAITGRRVPASDGSSPAGADVVDIDATVRCSSGTYIRALARDLGAILGTGGHLTALRRTRVGPYSIVQARTLEDLSESFIVTPLEAAAAAAFPRRDLSHDEARVLSHGGRLSAYSTGRSRPGASVPANPHIPKFPEISAHEDSGRRGPGAGDAGQVAAAVFAAFGPDGTLVALIAEEAARARPLVVFALGL